MVKQMGFSIVHLAGHAVQGTPLDVGLLFGDGLVVRCQPVPRLRTSPRSDSYSAGARPSVTPAGAGVSCLSSISSNVRPLGSNPNTQNPITPRIYHAAK